MSHWIDNLSDIEDRDNARRGAAATCNLRIVEELHKALNECSQRYNARHPRHPKGPLLVPQTHMRDKDAAHVIAVVHQDGSRVAEILFPIKSGSLEVLRSTGKPERFEISIAMQTAVQPKEPLDVRYGNESGSYSANEIAEAVLKPTLFSEEILKKADEAASPSIRVL